MRDKMIIQELTDKQLSNLVENYRRAGKTEGGKYSLAEVRLEQQRRRGIAYNGRDAALKIIELAKASNDGLVTFLELWQSYYPGKKWVGMKCKRQVMQILEAASYYCAKAPGGPIPIVTAAVVKSATRDVSQRSKDNIYNAARERGVETGHDVEAFYQAQLEGTKILVASDLPE